VKLGGTWFMYVKLIIFVLQSTPLFLLTNQLLLFLLAYWMWDKSPLGDYFVWFHINIFGIGDGTIIWCYL
jgi:hypothetical protein